MNNNRCVYSTCSTNKEGKIVIAIGFKCEGDFIVRDLFGWNTQEVLKLDFFFTTIKWLLYNYNYGVGLQITIIRSRYLIIIIKKIYI